MLMVVCLLAYLWFNASPSQLLMGDAGSRAIGIFIAITFLKLHSPFLFILMALMLIFLNSFSSEYKLYNLIMIGVILAYLFFNTSPSSMLMGDAGSRAIGVFIAIIAMKSRHPLGYLLGALVLIVDGLAGLIKIFMKRFLKISILKKTRTPIHDHVRKNLHWSDTQVVIRFVIIQLIIGLAVIYALV